MGELSTARGAPSVSGRWCARPAERIVSTAWQFSASAAGVLRRAVGFPWCVYSAGSDPPLVGTPWRAAGVRVQKCTLAGVKVPWPGARPVPAPGGSCSAPAAAAVGPAELVAVQELQQGARNERALVAKWELKWRRSWCSIWLLASVAE